jgi:uncharacterized membrane protein YdjX (TVP38/TMEM64 family)
MRLIAFFKTRTRTIPATWVAGGLWCLTIIILYWFFTERGLSLRGVLFELFQFFTTNPWAPLLYMLVYTLQPFAFLPSTVFTILAGSIFGFWPALIYTVIGANLSASAVYWTGRGLGKPVPGLVNRVSHWIEGLLRAPFLTILFMRLAYFPFDVVNFVSGLLRLRYLPFVGATALGSLPGLATFTALGTSLDLATFLAEGITPTAIDIRLLVVSAGLFVLSIAIAEGARRLQRKATGADRPVDRQETVTY